MSVKDELKLYHDSINEQLRHAPAGEPITAGQLRAVMLLAWRAVEADREQRHHQWLKDRGLDKVVVNPVVTTALKTRHDVVVTFGATGCPQHTVTVPAGTRCVPTGDNPNEVFVDDLSWLVPNSLALHDTEHRGIRLDRSKVSHES